MVLFSVAGHALLVFGSVVSMPKQQGIAIPNVITVDVMVAPAAPRPAPAAPRAKPKPKPKPKQVVLPERPSTPQPKPKPRRREEVVLEPKPKEEKSLDDLLDQFREQQGEPKAAPAPPRPAAEPAPVVATATASAGIGVPVSAEELDWMRAAKIRVRDAWVVPPNFRLQSLQTEVVVKLDAAGNLRGKPRIVQASGNPWYDEGVVRSIEKADLPPPPEPGEKRFIFKSDEY